MTEDQKKKLEQKLWNIADELRGKMHADEFRDYCLGFIFYKYLSEKLETYVDNKILGGEAFSFAEINEQSDEGKAYIEEIRNECILELGYFLTPSELFASIAKRGAKQALAHHLNEQQQTEDEEALQQLDESDNFIIDELSEVLRSIERSTMGTDSEEDFDHLFEDLDLNSTKLGRTASERNALIATILSHLNEINFAINDSDLLGDAYEYLIGQFAAGAGKKAGEFYTPQAVSTILAKLVTNGKQRLKNVYDPTCGSGSLLLRVQKEVEKVGDFYGQEMNRTTYNLARMNMILHDVHFRHFDIRQENTLEKPQHIDEKFEAIVANPPFSAKWSAAKRFETDDRYAQYGKLAPASKADFAFIQHMLYQLADNGTMAVVLPHGVLFRGAAEGHIRRYIIEQQNWLDAVIGLPANIFYGTSIPTCILVLKKCRENPTNVLFIDASQQFEKAKNQNYLRPTDIEKIIASYQARKDEDKYSYVADLTEIAENDYNLNIPRYVDTFEEEEPIDLDKVTERLQQIESEMEGVDKTIAAFCDELGIKAPF